MSSSPIASLAAIALGVAVAAAPPLVLAQTHVSDIEVREPMPLQPGHEMKSATVKFGDLNINAASGADALVKRLKKAAKKVCAPEPHIRDLKHVKNYNDCVDGAMNGAVSALGNTHVTEAYGKK
jgi:UrcA family protein